MNKLYKLEQTRCENGYSVNQMANFLNISKTFYWQIEKGQRNLSYIMACKISKIFRTKPDNIFYEDFTK